MAETSARTLFRSSRHGHLATHSADSPGYPFGSLVAYSAEPDGSAVVLLSSLAQHTANVDADPKVSLMVVDESQTDPQALARLTVLADASRLGDGDADAKARYHALFPDAMGEGMGFRFYRLRPVRARYIGGFGRISWIEPAELAG